MDLAETLAAHIVHRLKLLTAMQPLDERARITQFARTDELHQLLQAIGCQPFDVIHEFASEKDPL